MLWCTIPHTPGAAPAKYLTCQLQRKEWRREIDRERLEMSRRSILVVDDERDMLMLVKHLLEPEYRVRLAESSMEALSMVQQEMPDLVLLDIMMPGMNGWDFLERFRKLRGAEKVPVVIFTVRNEATEVLSGLSVEGVVDYITKPFDAEELKKRIREALNAGSK